MKFKKNNDGGIECHFDLEERELIWKALRHYSAYGVNESYILEQVPKICEILNILDCSEFDKFKQEKLK